MPMRVSTELDSQSESAILKIQSVVGRGLWLFQIKHLLTKTVDVLLSHKWTIIKAPKGINWFTSDNPVIKLNYRGDNYNFKGGWGSKGTEILLPISPEHMLYTKIGGKPLKRGTVVSEEMARMIQQFTVENAYRFIFSTQIDLKVECLRPRIESKFFFDEEMDRWKYWHELNVCAERDLLLIFPCHNGLFSL